MIRWRQFYWQEYAAELLGTLINIFVGLSAIVFDFGTGFMPLKIY